MNRKPRQTSPRLRSTSVTLRIVLQALCGGDSRIGASWAMPGAKYSKQDLADYVFEVNQAVGLGFAGYRLRITGSPPSLGLNNLP